MCQDILILSIIYWYRNCGGKTIKNKKDFKNNDLKSEILNDGGNNNNGNDNDNHNNKNDIENGNKNNAKDNDESEIENQKEECEDSITIMSSQFYNRNYTAHELQSLKEES